MKKTKLIIFSILLISINLVLADGGGIFTVNPASDAGWDVGGSQTIFDGEEDFTNTNDVNLNGIYDWYETAVCNTATCLGPNPNADNDTDGHTNKEEFCNFYIVNGEILPTPCSPGCGNGFCEFTAAAEDYASCSADCSSGCTEGIMTDVCEPNKKEYYIEGDFSSCGDCSGVWLNQQQQEPQVPEFTPTGLIIIIVLFSASLLILKKKKQ
ncbi:hypothetical protein KY345_01565 [Candidatus Woesearchaeota archaeon]|nr:hypothetical protein [Candidatus Woesearchaeota archaeon]